MTAPRPDQSKEANDLRAAMANVKETKELIAETPPSSLGRKSLIKQAAAADSVAFEASQRLSRKRRNADGSTK